MDIEKIGADYGFTLDSGDVGHFEYENFSANAAVLKIKGLIGGSLPNSALFGRVGWNLSK